MALALVGARQPRHEHDRGSERQRRVRVRERRQAAVAERGGRAEDARARARRTRSPSPSAARRVERALDRDRLGRRAVRRARRSRGRRAGRARACSATVSDSSPGSAPPARLHVAGARARRAARASANAAHGSWPWSASTATGMPARPGGGSSRPSSTRLHRVLERRVVELHHVRPRRPSPSRPRVRLQCTMSNPPLPRPRSRRLDVHDDVVARPRPAPSGAGRRSPARRLAVPRASTVSARDPLVGATRPRRPAPRRSFSTSPHAAARSTQPQRDVEHLLERRRADPLVRACG